MIGAGTGVAPFIGFLEERRARGDGGRNWLFFGEQRRSTDHYYANELDAFRADGVLHHLDLAFSRDQPHRVYVQHRICEQGARLWAWLEGGAHVYVCGDMNGMAKGVHAALHDLVALHGGMSVRGGRRLPPSPGRDGPLLARRLLRAAFRSPRAGRRRSGDRRSGHRRNDPVGFWR